MSTPEPKKIPWKAIGISTAVVLVVGVIVYFVWLLLGKTNNTVVTSSTGLPIRKQHLAHGLWSW